VDRYKKKVVAKELYDYENIDEERVNVVNSNDYQDVLEVMENDFNTHWLNN